MSGEIQIKTTSKGKVFGIVFLLFILGTASWVLWQFNTGKELADQLIANAEQNAKEGTDQVGNNSEEESPSVDLRQGNEVVSSIVEENSKQSNTNTATNSSGKQVIAPGESKNSSDTSLSDTGTEKINYKELVTSTYSNTLQTMENVKANTLALQNGKISLSGYKASIIEARQKFETHEKFMQTNPPSDPKLKPSYQEFLAGVKIARESMDVVLSGISSFNPSSLYAARDMGKTARDKVVNAYKNF